METKSALLSEEKKLKLIRENPQLVLREEQRAIIVPATLATRVRVAMYRP